MPLEHTGPFEQSLLARREGKLIVRREEATVVELPERNNRQIIYHDQLPLKTVGFHVAEYPPNRDSGMHRFNAEAVIYIIEGEGHTIIDGERVDWKAGDAVFLPPMSWHSQHSHDCDVKLIGVWNVPLMDALGMYFQEEAGDTGVDGAEAYEVRSGDEVMRRAREAAVDDPA